MFVTDFDPRADQAVPLPAPLAPDAPEEARTSPAPNPGAGPAAPAEDTGTAEGAPRALADLIAAGLVTHEMICDPGRAGAAAPALGRLCALVGGAIYRIGPFHYAFRAEAGDMEGALGLLPVDDWTGVLEAALRAELGPEAVWLYPTDLLSDALALGAAAAAPGAPLAPVALLRPREAAVAAALEAAPEGLRAVIDAAYAGETARLTAARINAAVREGVEEASGPALLAALRAELVETARAAAVEAAVGAATQAATQAAREAAMSAARGATETVLAAATEAAAEAARAAGAEGAPAGELALRLAALESRIEGQLAALAAPAARLAGIEEALAGLAARLDRGETRHDLLGEHLAEHLTLRLGAAEAARASESTGRAAAFEETLGLALAEFLARIEQTVAEPPARPRPC